MSLTFKGSKYVPSLGTFKMTFHSLSYSQVQPCDYVSAMEPEPCRQYLTLACKPAFFCHSALVSCDIPAWPWSSPRTALTLKPWPADPGTPPARSHWQEINSCCCKGLGFQLLVTPTRSKVQGPWRQYSFFHSRLRFSISGWGQAVQSALCPRSCPLVHRDL